MRFYVHVNMVTRQEWSSFMPRFNPPLGLPSRSIVGEQLALRESLPDHASIAPRGSLRLEEEEGMGQFWALEMAEEDQVPPFALAERLASDRFLGALPESYS